MKKDWEVKNISEVCQIVNGGTPNTRVPEYWNGTNLWITPKDMGKVDDIYVDNTERKITDDGLKNSSAKLIPINSVILSTRAPIGHLAINTKEMSTNQGCKGIVPNKELSSKYLFYFLKNSVPLLNSLGSGTTFLELSSTKLAEVQIRIPSLNEQQRIVSLIDEAFEAIDKAKENAEKNLQNAKEIFESYWQSIFATKGDNWEEKKLGDICTLQRGFDLPKQSRTLGDFPLVSSSGVIDTHNTYKVKGPGVATGRSGSIGNVFYIEEDFWPLNTVLYIKDFHGNDVRFIYYLLKQFDLRKYSSGTGVPTLNRNNVHVEIAWIPKSITEQRSIVTKMDILSEETKKLEKIYQQKLTNLEELKKSILQKAFNGEL